MNASCNGSWDGTQAEVNGQLLGEPQVNLRFLGCWFDDKLYGAIDIIGVQADAGAKLKATATVHDTKPKLCTNLDLYGYASVGVNTDFGIGKWLKNHTKLTLTKVILDDNAANPLRRTWHYEDGKRAEGDKCTYKKDERKNALKAYQKFLKKYQSAYKYSDDENIFITNSEDHKYCSGFMIKDMNGDNIPELIIDHFESFKSWSTYVFTFKNGKIKEVTKEAIDGSYNAGGYMETYFCKENHLHVHYLYGLLGEWNTAYSINKKGELYKYLEFERIIKNIDDWDTEREKQNYKYKGEKIGKSRYQKIEKKCGSNKYYWRENTEKERSKII